MPSETKAPWRHVLAPWKEGGRTYTYLLPPEFPDLAPGDTIMVEAPKGGPKFLVVESIQDLAPMAFPCKPIANVWSKENWATMQAEAEDLGPDDAPTISMNENYPSWLTTATRINAGEEV